MVLGVTLTFKDLRWLIGQRAEQELFGFADNHPLIRDLTFILVLLTGSKLMNNTLKQHAQTLHLSGLLESLESCKDRPVALPPLDLE